MGNLSASGNRDTAVALFGGRRAPCTAPSVSLAPLVAEGRQVISRPLSVGRVRWHSPEHKASGPLTSRSDSNSVAHLGCAPAPLVLAAAASPPLLWPPLHFHFLPLPFPRFTGCGVV